MRKILCIGVILTLAMVTVGAFAADRPVIKLPKTTSGSPATVVGGLKFDPHSLAQYKTQNRLSSAMNSYILRQQSGTAFKNGTIDTVPYFNSWFVTGEHNSVYTYSMLGHNPAAGGTTTVQTEIIPLVTELDIGGVPYAIFDPSGVFVAPADQDSDQNLLAESPMYDATTAYPGPPAQTGQLVDTAQRTALRKVRTANWHTNLTQVSSPFIWYQFLEYNNGDWTLLCCDPNGNPVPVVNINTISNNFEAIVSYPLELAATTNNIVPIIVTDYLTAFIPGGGCCVLGYHSAQPGTFDPNGVLVWTWATWIPHNLDQGLLNPFGQFGADVMVTTHEVQELINDPFVQTTGTLISPWVDGSVQFAQSNLEVGDAIEAMAAADVIYPDTLNTSTGPYTYTLQNTALLEWFTRNPLSGGIYSWPSEHTLNQAPHGANCTAPFVCSWLYGQGSAAFYFGPPY